MKLSGVGLEPHECNDEFLSKRLGISKATLIFVGVILGLIVLVGLIFFFYQLATYDFENAIIFLAVIPVFGLIFGIPGFFVFREAREIQKELDKRAIQTGDNTYAEKTRKTSRRFLISVVVGIAIFVVALIVALNDPSERCIECGHKGVYSKYGYCYSCYKGVENNIRGNGK